MVSYDFSGILIVLGGVLLFYGMAAVYLYTIFAQVRYIVAVWRSEMPPWKKLLTPVVMAAWAMPPVVAVSIKTRSEINGQPLTVWQWSASAVGIGVLLGVSVWLCRMLLGLSWRRSVGGSLAIFAVYVVMLMSVCPGAALDTSRADVQYQKQQGIWGRGVPDFVCRR